MIRLTKQSLIRRPPHKFSHLPKPNNLKINPKPSEFATKDTLHKKVTDEATGERLFRHDTLTDRTLNPIWRQEFYNHKTKKYEIRKDFRTFDQLPLFTQMWYKYTRHARYRKHKTYHHKAVLKEAKRIKDETKKVFGTNTYGVYKNSFNKEKSALENNLLYNPNYWFTDLQQINIYNYYINDNSTTDDLLKIELLAEKNKVPESIIENIIQRKMNPNSNSNFHKFMDKKLLGEQTFNSMHNLDKFYQMKDENGKLLETPEPVYLADCSSSKVREDRKSLASGSEVGIKKDNYQNFNILDMISKEIPVSDSIRELYMKRPDEFDQFADSIDAKNNRLKKFVSRLKDQD